MDWGAAKREYITTDVTQKTLAEKYGVTYRCLRQVAAAEKWRLERDNFRAIAEQKSIEKTAEKVADARAKLYEAAAAMIAELRYLITDRGDLKPRDITGAMKDCMDILGLKSDADIEEQRARIEKLRKEAQTETEQKTEITVRFEDME